MSVYGLYQPYKVNRPLTRSERNHRLQQGTPIKVKSFNCGESVIRMNSTYLETVDKFYKDGGTNTQFFALMFFMLASIYLYAVFHSFFLSGKEIIDIFIDVAVISVPMFGFLFWFGHLLLKEWFKWTHYPIRFNRKNKMVYVFRTNGTVLTAPWKDIWFTQDKEPGPLREWTIRGHILDKDGETVLETFSLGICENKESLPGYWEFIRCYMEEDVVQELADLVVLCPPIEDRKEGYIFGLQNLLYMESRLEWIYFPFMLPLNVEASVCRYITSQTGKIPRWPQEVLAACEPAADDPVNVSAADNPKNMWRLVFASEPIRVWRKRYKRMEDATNRIHDALKKRYG
ncbi:DUF6708 domain-containing protein [Mixta intestinalis]|uniref:DUF6708 domain-containing protein n=1 Tax=Mixta intestinalis TaxID=1615494 RepID=A0A6P1PZT6_9GAMM|nr:DUF6708 domain-containing protein [Mixta intestinalis]QHM71903.1 hypothetical protein C7M51_02196 [Mixta intestinalis]